MRVQAFSSPHIRPKEGRMWATRKRMEVIWERMWVAWEMYIMQDDAFICVARAGVLRWRAARGWNS